MKSLGQYNKIIIWGHPLYTHTTSYVMHSYYDAFKYIGWDAYHANEGFGDVKNAIIITEGVVDGDVPLDKSNFYILHNCSGDKYREAGAKFMMLQTWTKDSLPYEKINEYTYKGEDVLFQPWATNLLPHEIDVDDIVKPDTDKFYWVGTYGDFKSLGGNGIYVGRFRSGLKKHGIKFIHIDPWSKPATFEENMEYIRQSYVAPSISCTQHKASGYLSCRTWKNISYGHFCITNSWSTEKVFNSHGVEILYDADEFRLAERAVEFRSRPDYFKVVREQKMAVKENHTFINRANALLDFIKEKI